MGISKIKSSQLWKPRERAEMLMSHSSHSTGSKKNSLSLKQNQHAKYVSQSGCCCIVCKSENIKRGRPYFEKNRVKSIVECKYCGSVWYNIYQLNNVEITR